MGTADFVTPGFIPVSDQLPRPPGSAVGTTDFRTSPVSPSFNPLP